MEDKDIKNIINNINNKPNLEEDVLKIEEEIFFKEDIPRMENEDKLNIKNIIYEKINNNNYDNSSNTKQSKKNFKLPTKYMKVASITALVIGSIAIMYPVAANIIDKFYSYVQSEGKIVQSSGEVYTLESPIVKNIDGRKLELENIILDLGNNTITTKIIGPKVEDKSSMKIGNVTLESNEYSQGSGGGIWVTSHSFSGEFDYKENDNITYKLTSADSNYIEFSTKLKKVESTSDYKNLGNSDIKNKVAITVISTQDKNILDVNLIAKVEGKYANVYSYGKEFYKDEYDTGIILRDSSGKIIKGKLVHHGDRGNNFKFDVTDLVKPYTIEIPSVTLDMYGSLEGEEISLNLPIENSEDINKEIRLKGSNELIISENDRVVIKSIENIDENQYKINFDYPENDNSKFKISNLRIDSVKGNLTGKRDFTGYSSDLNVDTEVLDSIIFETENKSKDSVKFKLYPNNYKVEGSWKITIE